MAGIALSSDSSASRNGQSIPARSELTIAVAALLAAIAMQFPLIWQRSIHWDEFFHFSEIYQFSAGLLTSPLQTVWIRLSAPVIGLQGDSIDHIVYLRFFMFGFEMLAAASVAAIAARFTDKTVGLICAAAYIGGGFVFQHGFSFRADPMLAGLLTSSLWILLVSRLRLGAIMLCGFLLAVAAMISIKAVLFAPAFAGIAWLRWNEAQFSREWLLRLIGVGAAAVVAFSCIYFWHAQGLSSDTGKAAKHVVSLSANKMFGFDLPYLIYMAKQVLLAPVLAACLFLFPGALLRSRYSVAERVSLAALFSPFLTLFYYHNTAPYYYTFMLPPVVAALSIVIAELRVRFGTLVVAGLFTFTVFMLWIDETSSPIRNQRILLAAAEKMFPERVNYFDFCAFLGSFPKANNFMTPWGIENYLAGRHPSIRQTLGTKTVPLVMENDPMFTRLLRTNQPVPEFLPDDAAALRATYIHLWGPYWIAGKEFGEGQTDTEFEILVPGAYTVRGPRLLIDQASYGDGDVLTLGRGKYRATAPQGETRLVWGNKITPPATPAPAGSFWTPF